jgi:Ran GTPase-activating protein (RanGAP) involved in mRNA processing and transport
MRALLVLNLAKNNLCAEGIKLLAEALKGSQIMTELSASNNNVTWDDNKVGEMSGVIALANTIPDMGAMTKLDVSSNCLYAEGGKRLAEALNGSQVLTELNISDNRLAVDRARKRT